MISYHYDHNYASINNEWRLYQLKFKQWDQSFWNNDSHIIANVTKKRYIKKDWYYLIWFNHDNFNQYELSQDQFYKKIIQSSLIQSTLIQSTVIKD